MNEWIIENLKKRGINYNIEDGTVEIKFFGNKYQKVENLAAAIRQQKHIIDQQISEQNENTEFGKLMRKFHDTVLQLTKMTKKEFTIEKQIAFKNELYSVLTIMSKKREDLRKDGYERLKKVMAMIEKDNLPAANVASQAALLRMRRRWMVNQQVIDKSYSRLAALNTLKV
jgi:acylphosphatase